MFVELLVMPGSIAQTEAVVRSGANPNSSLFYKRLHVLSFTITKKYISSIRVSRAHWFVRGRTV